ncbi:MAG: head-tail connector protein [Pararhizobium sp.]
MWYPSKVIQPASATPVSVQDAQRQCGIEAVGSDDEALLQRLIAAASRYVERYCGIRLMTQTVEAKCDGFEDFAYVSEAPVQSISYISYLDPAGEAQTLDPTGYELRNDDLDVSIVPTFGSRWPGTRPRSRITVTAVVGYDSVDEPIRQALLRLVQSFYLSVGAEASLMSETVDGVGELRYSSPVIMQQAIDGAVASLLCNYRRGV